MRLSKIDAEQADLIRRGITNKPRRSSCTNCMHGKFDSGDDSVGMGGYFYCGLSPTENQRDDFYTILQDYCDANGKVDRWGRVSPEAMADCCHHYESMPMVWDFSS